MEDMNTKKPKRLKQIRMEFKQIGVPDLYLSSRTIFAVNNIR